MIYDNTDRFVPVHERESNEPGFSIHRNWNDGDEHKLVIGPGDHQFSIFTDDGRGNGDYVCGTSDLTWARRIAGGLDAQEKRS